MRIWLYAGITQLIIWLGLLRTWILPWEIRDWDRHWQVRRDRTFYANSFESWSCCDCGLTHLTQPLPDEEPRFPAFRFIPVRPRGYAYRLRLGSGPSSPSVDEE